MNSSASRLAHPVLSERDALRHQPKAQEAFVRLSEMVQQIGPEGKLPSAVELRRQMGVSLTTLNVALRELEKQKRIYGVRGVGIFVAGEVKHESKRRNIVLICNSSFSRTAEHSSFWDMMMNAAFGRAQSQEEELSCHFTLPHIHDPYSREVHLHRGLMEEIASGQVQGVLGIGLEKTMAQWIEAQGVPVVAFAGPSQAMVRFDTSQFFQLGLEWLVQQGCRRIGLWSAVAPYHRLTQGELPRGLQIFQEVLSDIGAAFDPNLVQNNTELLEENGYTEISQQEQGYRAALNAWSREIRPDGVLINTDTVTLGALTALRQLGVRPGHELQIVSHANRHSSLLMGREHQMALLEYDLLEVVNQMFALLEARMAHRTTEEQVIHVSPLFKPRQNQPIAPLLNDSLFNPAMPSARPL